MLDKEGRERGSLISPLYVVTLVPGRIRFLLKRPRDTRDAVDVGLLILHMYMSRYVVSQLHHNTTLYMPRVTHLGIYSSRVLTYQFASRSSRSRYS